MRKPVDEEALRRLDERADALEARTTGRPRQSFGAGDLGAGYRVVAELIGGVLGGLGLGWGVDRFAGTGPWGMVAGLLVGSGLAIFLVARSAGRMSTQASAKAGPVSSVPFDDEDEEDGGP